VAGKPIPDLTPTEKGSLFITIPLQVQGQQKKSPGRQRRKEEKQSPNHRRPEQSTTFLIYRAREGRKVISRRELNYHDSYTSEWSERGLIFFAAFEAPLEERGLNGGEGVDHLCWSSGGEEKSWCDYDCLSSDLTKRKSIVHHLSRRRTRRGSATPI